MNLEMKQDSALPRRSRLRAGAIAVVLGVFLAGALASPANASASEPDWSYFTNWLASNGVSASTQASLLAKVSSGQLTDSMKSDLRPVKSAERVSAGQLVEVDTYADGSIVVTALERPVAHKGSLTPQAVSGCTYTSGGGFSSASNCLVSQGNGTTTMQFRANYSRYTGGAHIAWVGSASVIAHYGTATSPTLSIVRDYQAGVQPAVATEYSRFVSWDGASSEDLYLSLRVTSAQAWTTTY